MDDKDRKLPPNAGTTRAKAAANRFPLSIAASSAQSKGSTVEDYYNDLLHKTKRISQLLAYSWLSDEEAAEIPLSSLPTPLRDKKPKPSDIAHTLQYKGSQEIKELIKNLAEVDLDVLFGSSSQVRVSWESFDTVIHEAGNTTIAGNTAVAEEDLRYTLYLPYPPRPQHVTSLQLANWVTNKNPDDVGPPYPYIPLSGGG